MLGVTKAEAAYIEIRRRIITGIMAPGEPIQQEELAAELHVSTTPLREALRRLEAQRLVIDLAHHMARVAPLSLSDALNIYAVRLELDPLAARLAGQNATDETVKQARRVLEGVPSGRFGRLEQSREFHRVIYKASDNEVLTHVLESLWDRSDRYRYALVRDSDRAHVVDTEHVQMVEALEARDGGRLERLMREHLEASVRDFRAIADLSFNADAAPRMDSAPSPRTMDGKR